MLLSRRYCQRPFTGAVNRIRKEKHVYQRKKTRDVPKIPFPTEKQNGILNEMDFREAFRFKTHSVFWSGALLIVVRLVLPNRYSWITWKNYL